MKATLISVIIPTYNRAKSLPKAIESVKEQDEVNWELLIVDDGSVDNTEKVIRKYTDKRITYVYQEHSGVSVARNHGAKIAQGSYLLFLDSDDILLPGLFRQLNLYLSLNYDIICWEVLKNINGKKTHWKPRKLSGIYNEIKATFLAGSVLYKKSLFWQVGGYDPQISFGENYELGLKLCQYQRLKIKILNKPFLRYVVNEGERNAKNLKAILKSYFYLYEKHQNLYKQNPKDHAKMHYSLGFGFEKLNKKPIALKYYKKAVKDNPYAMKAYLKILYLYLFK